MTHTLRNEAWGRDVAEILSAAVNSVDPYSAVKAYVKLDKEKNTLTIGQQLYNLENIKRIFVVGAGKAVLPMAYALSEILHHRIKDGCVIVKVGQIKVATKIGEIEVLQAAHPLPDAYSFKSTDEILRILKQTEEGDLVIALISGGGSALMTAPVAGIRPEDIREISEKMMNRGAYIGDVNIMRRQIDALKGGGLARLAQPAKVAALILSDVVGDPIESISSGPTVPSEATHEQAYTILVKHDLIDEVSPRLLALLQQPTPHYPPIHPVQLNNVLIANNERAVRAAATKAQELGMLVKVHTTMLEGEARILGHKLSLDWLKLLEQQTDYSKPLLVIMGGEPTVTLQGHGIGGRTLEFALAAVQPLAAMKNGVLVALATDGDDGNSKAAGAVVTGESYARAQSQGLDPARFMINNDSFTFFHGLDDNIVTGQTKTNVGDIYFWFHFPDAVKANPIRHTGTLPELQEIR